MFSFYKKILFRQWRLAAIRLFCLAVAISCAVTFSITLLGDRLEQLFDNQAKEAFAADMVLKSTSALTSDQEKIVKATSLQKAQTLGFQTMVSIGDNFLLSSVKAVTDKYPLRGQLQVSNALFGERIAIQHGPSPGEVWVEDRVLNELGVKLGDVVNIGEGSFKISRLLIYEPDRGNSFYSFTPRIMMHNNDVAETEIVQPGSRVVYRYLFSGNNDELNKVRNALEGTLQLNQEFLTLESANQTLATAITRAYRFLHVTALIAILLGAIGASLVSYQYASEMTYQYAVFRCLGLQGKKMVLTILIPFLFFTLVAILIGILLGGVIHLIIIHNLTSVLPDALPASSYKPYVISVFTALVIVASFAWPFLNKLRHTPPKLLLNRIESQEASLVFTVIAMMTGLSILVFMATDNLMHTIYIIFILCMFVIFSYFITTSVISLIAKLKESSNNRTKLSVRMLSSNRRMVALQVIAIAITIFSLSLITTIRDDLLASWQSKVPEDAPNIFAINLFESEKEDFINAIEENGIPHSPLYPVVRGRLSAVNGVPIRKYASKESGRQDESLRRDLALTWSFNLAEDNNIVSGVWHKKSKTITTNENGVSVEQGLADNLEIDLGDRLEFTIETQKVDALVTSIRSVEWESFTPNFYMIFYPGSLDELPTSYIASLHLEAEQRPKLRGLVEGFPAATFFDVDFLLHKIRNIAKQISNAVEVILYFSLFASIVVFISIELILRNSRNYNTAIYKTIGAKTNLIQSMYRLQFIIIGIIAGVIAYVLNIIISYALSSYLIEGDFIFNSKTAIFCLFLTPLLVLIVSHFSVQQTKNISAKQLLNEY